MMRQVTRYTNITFRRENHPRNQTTMGLFLGDIFGHNHTGQKKNRGPYIFNCSKALKTFKHLSFRSAEIWQLRYRDPSLIFLFILSCFQFIIRPPLYLHKEVTSSEPLFPVKKKHQTRVVQTALGILHYVASCLKYWSAVLKAHRLRITSSTKR